MGRSIRRITDHRAGLGLSLCLALIAHFPLVSAHDHGHLELEPGQTVSNDPIDAILWAHIVLQSLAWGILFPTGMVLGLVRHRLHVPVQTLAATMAFVGYFLGHAHKGRRFGPNIHSHFAPILHTFLLAQIGFGAYLKLHLTKGIHSRIRPSAVMVHGMLGKLLPILSWSQILFGVITSLGFCQNNHVGQCLAHFVMGSSFIAYGVVLLVMLTAGGQLLLLRSGRSQEFYDSAVILVWGFVNSLTEHRWGKPWAHNDVQHTSMGIIWFFAGAAGMVLSYSPGSSGNARRNIIPGLVILLTGWAFSSHPQHLEMSTEVHKVFGYTLMAGGLCRIFEISFLLRDRPFLPASAPDVTEANVPSFSTSSKFDIEVNSFQYLPPFLLFAGGIMMMSASEEQILALMEFEGAPIGYVSYTLLLYGAAFFFFAFVNGLIYTYIRLMRRRRQVLGAAALEATAGGSTAGVGRTERRPRARGRGIRSGGNNAVEEQMIPLQTRRRGSGREHVLFLGPEQMQHSSSLLDSLGSASRLPEWSEDTLYSPHKGASGGDGKQEGSPDSATIVNGNTHSGADAEAGRARRTSRRIGSSSRIHPPLTPGASAGRNAPAADEFELEGLLSQSDDDDSSKERLEGAKRHVQPMESCR